MCVWVFCLPVCLWITICAVPMVTRRGHQTPRNGVRWLWASMWVLGTKPESYASTASVLKRWVISPASSLPNHILITLLCISFSLPHLVKLMLYYYHSYHSSFEFWATPVSILFFSFIFVFCSIQWFSLRGDWWWKRCIMKRCHHFIFVSLSSIRKCG